MVTSFLFLVTMNFVDSPLCNIYVTDGLDNWPHLHLIWQLNWFQEFVLHNFWASAKKMAPKRDIRVKKIISPGPIYF